MVAHTLQKALPDLTYITLTILLIMPILAVLLCLFETHHDDGFFTFRGQSAAALACSALGSHGPDCGVCALPG